ncbi:MAG TPA: HK97 gp10 family phage protein [Streptosporangiaceae bacterium]|jgi:hypothetical protein
MTAEVTIKLDQRAVNSLLMRVTSEGAHKAATVTAQRAQALITAQGRVRTGAMRASIVPRLVSQSADVTVYSVGSPLPYAGFQERGTRGSQAAPGRVLRFMPKGSLVYLYRPRTGPVPAAHFMRGAYAMLKVADFCP